MPDETVLRARSYSRNRFPGLVIAFLTARRTARGAVLWGLIFGVVVAVQLFAYTASYSTPESRAAFALSLKSNAGIQAFYGEIRDVGTAAGYVEWRTVGAAALLGAVWALLTASRLLRGEEESGRWELLLSGQTDRRRSTTQALAGLGGGLIILYAVTALLLATLGRLPAEGYAVAGGLYLSFVFVAPVAVCMAVAAVTSQLFSTRRTALIWASAVYGVMYLLRFIADSSPRLIWLRDFSPLGWTEQLHPLTGGQPLFIIPDVLLIVALAAAAVYLAGRRDLDSSIIATPDTAPPQTRLLGGVTGLTIRLTRMSMIAWIAGAGILGFFMGLLSKTAGEILGESPALEEWLSNLGARSRASENFLGLSFLLLVTLVSLCAASMAAATREEEARGMVENLLVRQVSRTGWMIKRLVVSSVELIALGLSSGVITWLAVLAAGAGVPFLKLVTAGLNTVPAALLVLGLGTLVHGILPRLTAGAAYAVIAWSFLIAMIGSVVSPDSHILDLSLFNYVAPMPAADFRPGSALVLAGMGLAAMAIGIFWFGRRDLAGQ